MSKGKRNRRTPKRKTAARLEEGLTKLTAIRMLTADRVEKLDEKIAAAEVDIKVAKQREAEEAAEQEASE